MSKTLYRSSRLLLSILNRANWRKISITLIDSYTGTERANAASLCQADPPQMYGVATCHLTEPGSPS